MSDSNIPHTWKSSTDVQRRSVFARLDTLEAQVADTHVQLAAIIARLDASHERMEAMARKLDLAIAQAQSNRRLP